MSAPALSEELHERVSQVMADTKKRVSYNKSFGGWSWYDRDEEHNIGAWHSDYPTAWDAMYASVEPYFEAEDES